MQKKIKCEYCGRRISEEICPYCGGINSHGISQLSQPEPDQSPVEDRSFILRHKSLIFLFPISVIIIIAIVFLILFNVGTTTEKSASYKFVHEKIDPSSEGNQSVEISPYYLFEVGSSSSSDHVLEGNVSEPLKISSVGTEHELLVPCDYNELISTFSLAPIIDYTVGSYETGYLHVTSVKPQKEAYADDSYGTLTFTLFNNSSETCPLEGTIMDSVTTYDISKISSFVFRDVELITDINSILTAFGQPSFQFHSENFYSISYETESGTLRINYVTDSNGNLGAKPSCITFINCRTERPLI